MKTITEIRLENFKKIAATFKSQRELADTLGESTGYINQLLHGKRGIGEKVARKFEEKLRMSRLSFDVDSIPASLNDDGEFRSPVEAIEVTPEELGFINLLRDITSAQRKNAFDIVKDFKQQNRMAFAELSHRYSNYAHS
jgi:transcriptional regulator with XRE-family HTH domain